jgi:hypothetical protein
MSDKKLMDVASLLDSNLDAIDDLPEFAVPPNGAYQLKVNFELKEVNKKTCIEAKHTVISVVELENAQETPPKIGDQFSQLFMLDNEFGQGNLKKYAAPFFAHFGIQKYGQLMTLGEVVIACSVKQRKDKEDPSKVYGRVDNIVIA